LSLTRTPQNDLPGPLDLEIKRVELRGASGRLVEGSVARAGSGRKVVFLHGLVGLNEHWEMVVEHAKDSVECILLELPLLALRGDDCSIDGVTELTVRFLQESLDEPAVLVGNSFGGHVALRVALARPDLVGGLVLAGSSGLIEKSMIREVQLRPSKEWLRKKIAELFFNPDEHMREADIDRAHRELSDRGGARAMVKLSRSARRNHLGGQIREIRSPVLVVWGREDVVTPPEAANMFVEGIQDARIVWFDNCGHAPMIECPEEFAKALTEFSSELNRRETSDR